MNSGSCNQMTTSCYKTSSVTSLSIWCLSFSFNFSSFSTRSLVCKFSSTFISYTNTLNILLYTIESEIWHMFRCNWPCNHKPSFVVWVFFFFSPCLIVSTCRCSIWTWNRRWVLVKGWSQACFRKRKSSSARRNHDPVLY